VAEDGFEQVIKGDLTAMCVGLGLERKTARSDLSKPIIFNSPWMRGQLRMCVVRLRRPWNTDSFEDLEVAGIAMKGRIGWIDRD